MHHAAKLVRSVNPTSVVDLGCGDGGLLSLIKDIPSWGYDFQPSNKQGWIERGVEAQHLDVFGKDREYVQWGEVAVVTEVMEHLSNPHFTAAWIANNARYVVASSPHNERPDGHDPDCHIWAWSLEGYRALFEPHFEILKHDQIYWSQIILGRSRYV